MEVARAAQGTGGVRKHMPHGAIQREGKEVNRLPCAEIDESMRIQVPDVEHGLHRWFQ